MKWVIIILILLAAFGPVLWLVPSKKDRRLTRMRQRARSNGLRVDIASLPDLAAPASARVSAGGVRKDPTIQCAVYWAALPRALGFAPSWRVLRAAEATDGPLPGWQWDSERAGDPDYWQRVGKLIAALPADVVGIEASTREMGAYWQERVSAADAESSVDELAGILLALVDEQRAVDAFFEAQSDARFRRSGEDDET